MGSKEANNEVIQELSNLHWRNKGQSAYSPELVSKLYKEIRDTDFNHRQCMVLEFSQYLENYLWPNYQHDSSSVHLIISIAAIVNSKFRERISSWIVFCESPEHFPNYLQEIMKLVFDDSLSSSEQIVLITFLTNIYNSLEVDLIRENIRRTISIGIWAYLSETRREQILKNNSKLRRLFRAIRKVDGKLPVEKQTQIAQERSFLVRLIDRFLNLVADMSDDPTKGLLERNRMRLLECLLQLFIDLNSSLVTRRYFNALLLDRQVDVRCKFSQLASFDQCRLFCQLLEMLQFNADFGIDDETGEAIADAEIDRLHSQRIVRLQKTLFQLKELPDNVRSYCLSPIANAETEDLLKKTLSKLNSEQLFDITRSLGLLPPPSTLEHDKPETKEFGQDLLRQFLIHYHKKRVSQTHTINSLPLYPTESVIWDEHLVPIERYNYDASFALPKLNLQFLTILDYLLRNFHLFRLESTYEIRQDIEDCMLRLKPWKSETGETVFGGWSRMALPIQNFAIVEVAKPHLGQSHPSRVRADISLALNVRSDVRYEWEGLRRHDPCFLITVRGLKTYGSHFSYKEQFRTQIDVVYVRGCEVEGMLDDDGKLLADDPETRKSQSVTGDTRTWRVRLDPSQYQLDMQRKTEAGDAEDDIYDTFNVLLRRKPKENNFKAVLDTIRELMNTKCVVPDWLHDVLLGYEDPASAHYSKRTDSYVPAQDWRDTFLSKDHLEASFPNFTVQFKADNPAPPFRLSFPSLVADPKVPLEVTSYSWPQRYNEPIRKNAVRFTSTQVQAIRSGMQPGLTLVVGPPGTGKTDVAVQIISNLYHNYPHQRTLIVTHSNQALNQLFEKIIQLDVQEHHLLRLGHGEESLETEKDFSRYGRVNYVLAQRLKLLQEVGQLARSLGLEGDDAGYTCEIAGYFYLYHILSRWEVFLSNVKVSGAAGENRVSELFPFAKFFAEKSPPVFGKTFEEDLAQAQLCFDYIARVFKQLEEFRAFELMRTGVERANYLLVQEAKIIAMTCTHAALRRRDLVELGFTYDNILMEEAAQILEIETFIPLLLQNPDISGRNRLKRWIMIGDHHQLPPVIKNMVFQKHCNMEQSLFTRLIKLGVPTVQLDAQGRARDSICELYRWRYKKLDSLPHVLQQPDYQNANAGFVYDYQLINVGDYNGVGESEPNAFFFQNLAEAEYIVATYIYMRTLGYPADKISILTTYNGQKHLIRDVINAKCGENPMIGRPHTVTTVDRYQGQQNDYILLSLVRSKIVGHLRDVRRLIVALSRARLGIYIFGRVSLFESCLELQPAMCILRQRPQQLKLLPLERFDSTSRRQLSDKVPDHHVKSVSGMPEMCSFVYELFNRRLAHVVEQRRHQYEVERIRLLEQEKMKCEERAKRKLEEAAAEKEEEDKEESEAKKARMEEINEEDNVMTESNLEKAESPGTKNVQTNNVVSEVESQSVSGQEKGSAEEMTSENDASVK